MEKDEIKLSLYKHWVADLLAVHYLTGAEPHAFISSRGHGAKNPQIVNARKLLVTLWCHADEKAPAAAGTAWVQAHLNVSQSYLWRAFRETKLDRVMLAYKLGESIYPTISQRDVLAAIAAGWTGRESSGVSGWRAARRLQDKAQVHFQAESLDVPAPHQ